MASSHAHIVADGPWTSATAETPDALCVEQVDAATWDAALEAFDDVNYEQTAAYAERRWGSEHVICLLVRERGALVGAACHGLIRVPLLGKIGFCKYGPVWRVKGGSADPHQYRRIVQALLDHARDTGLALTIVPRAHPVYTELETAELAALGLRARPCLNGDHYIVDATLSAEEQMASFTAPCRANMRKALGTGVTVTELDDFTIFDRLDTEMKGRKGIVIFRPQDVLPALTQALPAPLRPYGLVAWHEGKPVAAHIYGILGDTAYYLYGATSRDALPVRAGYRLHWETLERIRGRARWYDLGISSENPGMQRVKEGLIGKRGKLVIVPHEFDYAPDAHARAVLAAVHALRSLRRSSIALAGTLKAKSSP